MKRIALLAIVACVLGTTACTVRSERTVVERPVPANSAAVVVPADSGPGPGTTTYVVRDR